MHVSKIRPLHLIAAGGGAGRRRPDLRPPPRGLRSAAGLLELFADRKAADAVKKDRAETVEGRLKDRIVDGDRKGLNEELDEALKTAAAAATSSTTFCWTA